MSETPYPIVRCTDPTARKQLAETLWAMGFDSCYAPKHVMSNENPYICLLPRVQMSTASDEEVSRLSDRRYWGVPMTLVNSPRQMIEYAKRFVAPKS